MEKFSEYMWYLLTAPFKAMTKLLNKWYLLFTQLGKKFDEAKESLDTARDGSMIATCPDAMLPVHAADRGLYKYPDETDENFRERIAMYEETCKLGGTREGMILTIRALGYEDVQCISVPELDGDPERWAEFYIVITKKEGQLHPIGFKSLQSEVRRMKKVEAKDNYIFKENLSGKIYIGTAVAVAVRVQV